MCAASTDRNLLFGILALQMDFINREQLIEAMHAWVLEKSTPLAEILVRTGALAQADGDLLEPMVDRHVQIHAGDSAKSLDSLSSIGPLRQQLEAIGDTDIEQSLGHVSAARSESELDSTLAITVGSSSSEGHRFHILRFLAKGGLGQVSVALDNELHREVALKEIRPERADDPEKRSRFVQEAEITGNLEHPGIVPIYGLGRHADGRPFYAMRFIRGDSLKDAIKRFHSADPRELDSGQRMLQLRKLLGRFIDVCDAMEYAHSRGVLHRDLKPGNIMLGKYGETLVVDWGLAKAIGHTEVETSSEEPTIHPTMGSGSTPTLMGAAVGTPAYMSPEQAGGRLDLLGPASDVYSLGATLYSLLTGVPPIDVDDSHFLHKIEQSDFPRPRQVNAQIPAALEAVCLKAMARKQANRYSAPRELADELERWLADEPVRAWREPLVTRTRRWVRRHRATVVGATTTAVLLIAVLSVFGLMRWRRLDLIRQQTKVLVRQGTDAAHADDLDRAISSLSRAAELSAHDPPVAELHRRVAERLRQMETHREFQRLADATLNEGIHALRQADGPDLHIEQATQALGLYGGTESPQWDKTLSNSVLTTEQIAETKSTIAKLLNMTGIRLALYDTKDEAGRKATERALKLFDLAEQLVPPTVSVWMARMLFNRRIGNDKQADEAGQQMTQLAKSGQINATDYYMLGIIALRISKDPKGAIDMFYQALAKEPNNYGAHFGIYLASSALKDTAGEIRSLTACMALHPHDAELSYFRGFTYFGQGQYNLAGLDFDACIQRDPNHATGHYWLGRTLIMDSKWNEAEQAFSRALAIDSALSNVYSWRAIARGHLGQNREAAADAEQALQLAPDDSTRWRCARAYSLAAGTVANPSAEAGEQALADKCGRQAVKLLQTLAENDYFQPQKNLASLLSNDLNPLHRRADFRQLRAQLAEPIIADPKRARNSMLILLRVTLLAERGQHAQAAKDAERLHQLALQLHRLPGTVGSKAAGILFNAACCYALCIPSVTRKTSPDGAVIQRAPEDLSDEEKALQDRYRDRAFEALTQAIRDGLTDAKQLKTEVALNSIRSDPRFQPLVDKLEKTKREPRRLEAKKPS